jgi:hypothetical protein
LVFVEVRRVGKIEKKILPHLPHLLISPSPLLPSLYL